MTAAESTRRDLAVIKGWEFVPLDWDRVDEGSKLLGQGGMVWMVMEPPTKAGELARVELGLGRRRKTVEVPLHDGVHVLDHVTGPFSTEHAGAPLVRARRGVS